MSGFLFGDIVFGPVHSRRFGSSLGINLLPLARKVCTFNCVYCECGLTHADPSTSAVSFYDAETISQAIVEKFSALARAKLIPDSITFAGNGEPTLHPQFPRITDIVIDLRNRWLPGSKITVLSNATLIHRESVRDALMKVDNNVLKLDAGTEEMLKRINRPLVPLSLPQLIGDLMKFEGRLIIQTLFLKGKIADVDVDNTSESEISAWLDILLNVRPKKVMIYPIDRATAENGIERIRPDILNRIARKVETAGIKAEVYY